MKLIFCIHCRDLKKIHRGDKTYCKCKKSYGWYHEDGDHASFGGHAIPIGISNKDIMKLYFWQCAKPADRTDISMFEGMVDQYKICAFSFREDHPTIHFLEDNPFSGKQK